MSHTVSRCMLICAICAICGCKPEPSAVPTPAQVEEPRPVPAAMAPDPVGADHYVFVGKPLPSQPLDCPNWDSPDAPHRGPGEDLHDATDYPERHSLSIEVAEVVQGPKDDPPVARRGSESGKPEAVVAFALGPMAFHHPDYFRERAAYDKAYCERLNALLASPFIVVHGFKIHVDRGNSPDPTTWHSLGTDPAKANRGFESLEAAKAHATALLSAKSPDDRGQ